MSKFCLAEIATLLIGWVSNLLFLVYSGGFFDSARPELLLNPEFLRSAAVMAFPYALTFVCCWLSRRFVKAFLLLSILLTIGSICAYFGFFVAQLPPDGGGIFVAVPFVQTMIAVVFSLVIFVISLVLSLRSKPAIAARPAV